jgi:hypothetical protein
MEERKGTALQGMALSETWQHPLFVSKAHVLGLYCNDTQ